MFNNNLNFFSKRIASKRNSFRASALVFSLLFCSTLQSNAQSGDVLFKQNCAACHSIGKGRLVGPDLMGITSLKSEEWLLKWTKSSQTLIKSGDAEAKAIFDEYGGLLMPDQNLPDADIKAIFAFIASKGTDATAQAEPVSNASDDATPEEIEIGKQLFIGSKRLNNGGAACISCHNVDYAGVIPGGLLAKDLTTVFSRMGGDAGLKGILGAPPFPAMTQAYKDNPITDEEVNAITAFLNKVDKDTPNQVKASFNPLLYGGVAGVIALLWLFLVIWFGRKKYTVKRAIFDRQLKSI